VLQSKKERKKREGKWKAVLHLLLGRARSGKSERVLQRIAALGDSGRQILLVPEHASHVAEVDVCRACGDGASRHAEVLTFKLLASRVLALTGGSADVTLDSGGKLLTLQLTLQELSPMLQVYRRPSQRSAFLESLLAVMEELQAYAVAPETLSECAARIDGASGDKLRDIALIYGIYLAELREGGRDARDRLEKAEEKLEESGYADGKDIFIDGFSYFTGRELRILRILLRRARSVTVTLLGDGRDGELFRESLRMRDALTAIAQEEGVRWEAQVLPAGEVRSALDHVERHFFGRRETWAGDCGAIRLYEATGVYAEVEHAAAEILALVRSGAYRFRDITVTARALDAYAPVLETVFARCGIPLYTARRSDILRQSTPSLVLGALDAVCGGFEYEDMFRFLKTGLAGLTHEECDVLENYVLKWDVRGSMWLRGEPWTMHPDGYGMRWSDEAHARLDTVNALRERVRGPLGRLSEGVRGTSGAGDKVRALYAYLEELHLSDTLQALTERLFAAGEGQRAEETAQLWAVLCSVMDQFVSILGDRALEAEEFVRLFRLVLTQYSVGTIPAALDQVNCAEMTRNDRHTVRALFLLGANDGVLPKVDEGGGVLREEDRVALEAQDIRLAPYGMRRFRLEMQNLYAALAQPTERLCVSYPCFDAQGGELQPSFVIGRLTALCPRLNVEKEDADKAYRLTLKAAALEYAGAHIDGAAWRYFEGRGDCAAQLAAMRATARYTRGRLSQEVVRSLYGTEVRLSASKMDKARSCHFAYFMQYGLRAKERSAAGFDAPQVGTFVHDVMEHTLRRAEEEGGLRQLTRDALHRLIAGVIRDYVERELPDLEEKTARFRYLFRRLCESVYRIMDEVTDELRVSDFAPLAFELSFGPDGQLPAISVRGTEGGVRVTGKVDRVDGWLKDGKLYLRVVDYKTGKKSFDLADVRYGLGLQMLLYLFALGREGREYFGREIVPAGVLYTPARDAILSCERGVSEEKLALLARKSYRRSGMLLADPEVLRAMEHGALEEPCYLPVKLDKNGALQPGETLASAEQLGKLGRYVEHVLRQIGQEVRSGNIDADPCARSPLDTACAWCEFAPACHFEPGRGSDRIEYIRATGGEEFWKFIGRAADGEEAAGDG